MLLDRQVIGVYSTDMDQKQSRNKQRLTQQALRRLRIIKGQVEGLARLIEGDEYCIEILNQSLAIQNSLKSLDALILERHLITHLPNQFRLEPERAVRELLKVFRRAHKGG